MALTKEDLQDIKEVVVEVIDEKVPGIVAGAVEPYFQAIQQDFHTVYAKFDQVDKRFDRLESLINDDYKSRIEKLEVQVKELRDALAMK